MRKITKITVYYDDGTFEDTYNYGKPNPIPASPTPAYPNYPAPPIYPTSPFVYPYNPYNPPYTITCKTTTIGAGIMEGTNMNGGRGESNES